MMTREEFDKLSDDAKWLAYVEVKSKRPFTESKLRRCVSGILRRELNKQEKNDLCSFYAYCMEYGFRWKNGDDITLMSASSYVANVKFQK